MPSASRRAPEPQTALRCRGALELIADREDEEAPVEISRYDLQLFLWYQLPRKLLASLEVKRAVAERLGRFLELAGDGATAYAEICTCEQTMAMLEAWEAEEPDTVERLREALEASGLEPPDTDALRWRSMMGFEEARRAIGWRASWSSGSREESIPARESSSAGRRRL